MQTTVQPLVHLLEATTAVAGRKNLSGNIQDPNALFQPKAAAALEKEHPGVFAFLVFHPALDAGFKDYVSLGAIGAEAGKNILVLFTLETPIYRPKKMAPSLLQAGLTLQSDEHPAYEFARALFTPRQPPLPGVVFFRRLAEQSEPVYVPLARASSATAAGKSIRQLFVLANESYSASESDDTEFADKFSKRLALNNLEYERIKPLSALELLARAFYTAKRSLGDIVAVVSLFK